MNVFTYGILMRDGNVAATLPGYRLDFGYHASVVEDDTAVTYGVLVTDVTAERLAVYDSIEHVEGGYYSRRLVTVQTPDGDREAWVYVMAPHILAEAKRDGIGLDDWAASRMNQQYQRVGHGPEASEQLETLRLRTIGRGGRHEVLDRS